MRKSREERSLLEKLAGGKYDGRVGNSVYTSGGSEVWTEIRNGNPVRYKQGPGGKFFNGKENERYEGVKHTLKTWDTPDEKTEFLQNFGWLLKDEDARSYSARFKKK